jgi:hypothetical protein
MYHVLLVFLAVMPVCYFLGYIMGVRKGIQRANRKNKAQR